MIRIHFPRAQGVGVGGGGVKNGEVHQQKEIRVLLKKCHGLVRHAT